ncbi:MAG: class I tRNA ligase family protein [Clostridia bacterium]|nr:class I tRNA ligase family protein [Clostridia bacterium]
MSKTLGNGIDPLDIIDKYGADSLRFSVLSGTTMGNDIRFMQEKLDQASNFANKIWNAAKFITNSLADENKVREFCYEAYEKNHEYNAELFRIEDKWILNKFDKLVADVTKNIENYDLGIAIDNIYTFIWNEFCDWYIEMCKTRIYSNDENERIVVSDVLNHVFGSSLKLLHPFMPFVTSEIYSKLICFGTEDLMVSSWPTIRNEFLFDEEEIIVEKLKKIIIEIRNIRAKMNVHPSKKTTLIFVTENHQNAIKEAEEFLIKLGFGNKIVVQSNEENIPEDSVSIVVDDIKVFLPFEELVDINEEIQRLNQEKQKLESEVERGEKMLSNPGFINKAPEKKINEEKEKLANYKQMLETVSERLSKLKQK